MTKIQSIENELKQISLNLFGLDKETKRKIADKKKKLDEMLKDKEEIESSIIYKDAFEWRFEFPELLDSNGDFIGFDAIIGNPPYIQIQTFTITQKESWKKQNYQTFEATGDIYCLFYEKGNQILRNNGILSYITSNKWMRAGYGESTRNYFCENTNPLLLIDLGGFSVFDFATVDTNILLFKKIEKSYIYEQDNLLSCIISNKTIACSIQKDFKNNYSLQEYVKKNQVILDNLTKESWIILSKKEFDIKKKIEEKGIPLKDWDILINRGVTTGLNEAFIIDEKKKTELIKLDPKNAEIIKPILRGRDIKKYKSEFANLWIISTFPSLKINIDKYPLIRDYLKTFGKKIEQTGEIYIDELGNKITSRKKTSNEWFETQDAIAYYKEFEKEKIVWQRITAEPTFCFSKKGEMTLDSMAFLSSFIPNEGKYIISILNSKVISFYVSKVVHQYGSTGYRLSNQYVENLPIPKISPEEQKPFEIMVDLVIFAKENSFEQESKTFESIIDALVYDLYFPEEMKKGNCYITDRIKEKVMPFKNDDTEELKKEYVKELYNFFLNDKKIYGSLIYNSLIDVVKIIGNNKNE